MQPKRHSHAGSGLAADDPKDPRRHSYNGSGNGIQAGNYNAASSSAVNNRDSAGKKGFFTKIKDKAIGTKEEREAYKKQQAEVCRISDTISAYFLVTKFPQLDRQRALQRQRQAEAWQAQMAQMRQQRQQQRPFGGGGMYASPAGNPYQMGGGYGGGRRRQGGFGKHFIQT